MAAYDIQPVKDGDLAAVSLGTSGLTLISFTEQPARAIDYVVNIGDVRQLGLVPDRFVLAAGDKAIAAINLEKYMVAATGKEEAEAEAADDEVDLRLSEAGGASEGERQVITVEIGQRANSIRFTGDRAVAAGPAGLSFIEVPEIGTELSLGKGLGDTKASCAEAVGKSVFWCDGAGIVLSDLAGKELASLRTDQKVAAMALCGDKLLVNLRDQLWCVDQGAGNLIHKSELGRVDRLLGFSGKALALKGAELSWLEVGETAKPVKTDKLRSKPEVLTSDGTRVLYAEGKRNPNDGFDRLWELKDGKETLLREVEGQITALAIDGDQAAFSASDTVETGERHTPRRDVLEVLEGTKVVAKGALGVVRSLVLRKGSLLAFDGGYVHLVDIANGELRPRSQLLANDIGQLELRDDLLLCCGWRGFRSYELRPGGPYYVSRSRKPEAKFFAIAGDSFFGFFGNRIERRRVPELRLPETGFVVAEGGIRRGDAPLDPGDVAKEYGKAFRVFDGDADVCSPAYEALRGYRLQPVHCDLSGEGWQRIEVEPDKLAVDPKTGRVKFSDGSPAVMDRIGQVAGIMYSPGGFQVRDHFLYISLGENANPFMVYDISDYAAPRELGLCPGGVRFPHDIAVDEQNEYAYFPVTYGGLEVTRVKDLLGSGSEMIQEPATVAATWNLPGAQKTFKLELTSGGKRPAERISTWVPPAGGSPTSAEVVGDVCYVSNRAGFFFTLDIKNRENPKLLGQCTGGGGIVAVKDGYAYTSGGGLTVIDVRDPSKPKPLGRVSEHKGEPLGLLGAPHEGLIGMGAPFKYGQKNFYLVSVNDPAAPKVLGAYIDPSVENSSGAAILPGGKRAILVDAGSCGSDYSIVYGVHGRLILLDISDPADIKRLNVFHGPDEGDYRGIQVDYEKMVAYVGDRSFGVWFFDIRDPAAPKLLGGAPASGEADYSYFWNDHLYFDTTAGGAFWAVDFTRPESPRKVGYFWDGVWTGRTDLTGKDGIIYAPLLNYGLKVIDGRSPASLTLADEIRVNVATWAYDVDGDRLYVAAMEKGNLLVKVYDLADPLHPKLSADLPLPGMAPPVKLDVAGQNLYVVSIATGREEFRAYRLKTGDAKALELAGSLPLAGALKKESAWEDWKLQVVGAKAFVFGDGLVPHLTILDVTNPKTVRVAFANPLDVYDRPMNFTVAGDYLYANWYYPGVQVFDVSDPFRPLRLAAEPSGPGGEFSKDAWSSGHVRGRYMYCPKLSFAVSFTVPRSTQAPLGKVSLRP
jgi:hypothetical protein